MSVRFCGIDWDDVRGDVFGSPECVCVERVANDDGSLTFTCLRGFIPRRGTEPVVEFLSMTITPTPERGVGAVDVGAVTYGDTTTSTGREVLSRFGLDVDEFVSTFPDIPIAGD